MDRSSAILGLVTLSLVAFAFYQQWARRQRRAQRRVGIPGPVTAFGTDTNHRTIELGPVSLSQGLSLIEERASFADQTFDTADDADAKTKVGFQRDPEHFIDCAMMHPTTALIHAGVGVTEQDREEMLELNGMDNIRELVMAYFNQPRDFGAYWQGFVDRRPLR